MSLILMILFKWQHKMNNKEICMKAQMQIGMQMKAVTSD